MLYFALECSLPADATACGAAGTIYEYVPLLWVSLYCDELSGIVCLRKFKCRHLRVADTASTCW